MTKTETDTRRTEANRRPPATPGDKGDVLPTRPTIVQPDLNLAITTIAHPRAQECETAHAIAAELNAPFIPRVNGQPGKTAEHSDREGLLIVEREGLALWVAGQTFRYHPNMATMRVRALSQKKNDGLDDALRLKTGHACGTAPVGSEPTPSSPPTPLAPPAGSAPSNPRRYWLYSSSAAWPAITSSLRRN